MLGIRVGDDQNRQPAPLPRRPQPPESWNPQPTKQVLQAGAVAYWASGLPRVRVGVQVGVGVMLPARVTHYRHQAWTAARNSPPPEIWRRRQTAAFWGVGLSTLDRWVARSDPRLPAPRLDPGGRPFWVAAEVRRAAAAPEAATESAAAPAPPAIHPPAGRHPAAHPSPALSDEEALRLIRRSSRR